ncbi:Bro-N domain-containing protein [Streptococcus infantarius]|uniref:BRO-N domain-containing protein n=1 Tax=Streptococcus infantarius TaxID=102684 RepID=UPI00208F0107|nr:BRO family protein [Streptococcus infantarius]MCO4601997.1 Phage antirepressor protein [Streptococcus infantarius subsp. infantarius]
MEKIEQWNGHSIRFVEHNGEWWAVAKDITSALGLKNNSRAISTLKGVTKSYTLTNGGKQQVTIIDEKAIYKLVFKSRKKEAEEFQDWVFEIIKQLRQQSGLEGFQAFRMLDKQHQKNAMTLLSNGLQGVNKEAKPKDLIKANTIANKAISNKYGYPKMVKKSEMSEPMLRDREQVLDETVELMLIKERYGLNFSVANTIYGKTC